MYAWVYKQYNKEANVKSIVIIARNKNDENGRDTDWKLSEMYREITNGYIEQFGGMNVLPKALFFHIDMISFDGKDMSVFEKIDW